MTELEKALKESVINEPCRKYAAAVESAVDKEEKEFTCTYCGGKGWITYRKYEDGRIRHDACCPSCKIFLKGERKAVA